MNGILWNVCLLFCTWTMRGVLENLNSKWKEISLSLRPNSKLLCHFQSAREENETTITTASATAEETKLCALFVSTIYFHYLFHLFTLSLFLFCLSHSNTTEIYIFNLFCSLSIVNDTHTASYPEWNNGKKSTHWTENKMPHNWRRDGASLASSCVCVCWPVAIAK